MKWIEVPIVSRPDENASLRGVVAECPDCGRREWYVFRLDDCDRLYVQCCYCDRIETADGKPATAVKFQLYALAQADAVLHPLTVPGKEVGQ